MDEEKVMDNPEYAAIMARRKKKERVSKGKKMAVKPGGGATDHTVLGLEAPNIAPPVDRLALPPSSGKVALKRARSDGSYLNNNIVIEFPVDCSIGSSHPLVIQAADKLVFPSDEAYYSKKPFTQICDESVLHGFNVIQKAMLTRRRLEESDRLVGEATKALEYEQKVSTEQAGEIEELKAKYAEAQCESAKLKDQLKKQKEVTKEVSVRLEAAKAKADRILEESDDKYISGRRGVLQEILKAKLSLNGVQRLLDDMSEFDSEGMETEGAPDGGPVG